MRVGLEILSWPSTVRRFEAPIPSQMNGLRLDILNHPRVSLMGNRSGKGF